jgi:hypothetical protein
LLDNADSGVFDGGRVMLIYPKSLGAAISIHHPRLTVRGRIWWSYLSPHFHPFVQWISQDMDAETLAGELMRGAAGRWSVGFIINLHQTFMKKTTSCIFRGHLVAGVRKFFEATLLSYLFPFFFLSLVRLLYLGGLNVRPLGSKVEPA